MSNFFREATIGFKPRSNIFSKLRVKDTDSHNGDSSAEADSSLMDDLFAQSQITRSDNQSAITAGENEDGKAGTALFQLASSTPRALKTSTMKGEDFADEDELEITEVRGFFTDNESALVSKGDKLRSESCHSGRQHANKEKVPTSLGSNAFSEDRKPHAAETSSNDVLLEAFNNTQRICSNLKQELQRQQAENSKLKSQMQGYHADQEGISQKFSELKRTLNNLNEKSRTLLDQKASSDSALEELKCDHEKLKKKIDIYKNDTADLKVNLLSLQSLKKDTDTELSKKAKEVDYLTRELNDCSGLLSEERLKNCSLVQEIGSLRNEFKESLAKHFNEKQNVLEESFKELGSSIRQSVTEDLKRHLKDVSKESFEIFSEQFSVAQQLITSVVHESSVKSSAIITNEFNVLQHQSMDSINNSLQEAQNKSKSIQEEQKKTQNAFLQKEIRSLKSTLQDHFSDNAKEMLDQVDHLGQLLNQYIDGKDGKVLGKIKVLSDTFASYREELKKSQDNFASLHEFESQVATLNMQKGQALSSLGIKEAQYDDLSKKSRYQEIELRKCKETEDALRTKVDLSLKEVESLKSKWVKLNEENITLKANSENKIIVQGEILKGLQSENELLKERCDQLDGARKQSESKNLSHNDKVQKISEQLQKMNVEMVQIKAHELELEEDNRKLKFQIEDNRVNYEEAADEFKRLRQKVIVLEAEKQDSVKEKIDLQDNNDELRSCIKSLKQKLNMVQATEPPIEKQKEIKKAEDKQDNFDAREQMDKESSCKTDKRTRGCGENDEFDLSSSLNDDLELTNPSPIQIKPLKTKRGKTKSMKPPNQSRKKLLLLDEDESSQIKHRWKKRRS